jgi:hypothetical protein
MDTQTVETPEQIEKNRIERAKVEEKRVKDINEKELQRKLNERDLTPEQKAHSQDVANRKIKKLNVINDIKNHVQAVRSAIKNKDYNSANSTLDIMSTELEAYQ